MPLINKSNAICFLCHPFHRGGVTKWMIEAAEEFTRQGKETWFVTVNPFEFISGGLRPTILSQIEKIDSLKIVAPYKSKSFEIGTFKGRSLQYAKLIYNHIPKGTPVIVSDDESIWDTSKYIGKYYPIIGVLHSDDELYYYLLEKYRNYLSSLVVVSERIKDKAIKISESITVNVIQYGIRLPDFKNKKKSKTLRIIWAGRIDEHQKRVSDIPKIAKILSNSDLLFHWTIVGHGEDADLKKSIENYNLQKYFTFTGWLDKKELYKKMDESDILVLTSNFEGLPLTVLEALSKGLGIVCTRVSGLEDLEYDPLSKYCIRLYEIGDVNKAAERIREVFNLPRRKMELVSREIAEQNFSIESCVNNYNRIILNIRFIPSHSSFKYYLLYSWIEMVKSIIISKLRYWNYKIRSSG